MNIDLDAFRSRMKSEFKKHEKVKSVQVSGKNLLDALKQASLELALPVSSLEYEILERGRSGFVGFKQSPCQIVAYKTVRRTKAAKERHTEVLSEQIFKAKIEPPLKDVDGHCSVRLGSDGVWIKIFPPKGKGIPVSFNDASGFLSDRLIVDFSEDTVKTALVQQDAIWVKVGEFDYNPMNNARIVLDVSKDEMEAHIQVTRSGPGGADITKDIIREFLTKNGVVYGVLDDALQNFEDYPVYDSPYLVAKGLYPVHGENAKVLYNFETQAKKIHVHERKDGSVDFKELNRFQNVVTGQPLARIIPKESGKDGRTVYGRYLPANDGEDVAIGLGNNVESIDDGKTVVASVSGHVMLKNGKINVETVLIIPDGVNSHSGNINALGSVNVVGNVEDGFSVSARGNIEVSGFVGKANLKSGGSIIVSRGINGGESEEYGHIIAAKSIWSSFIQNAQAKAGEFVIVSSGIVNSEVLAKKKVLCKGRRAKIVGGLIRASEEINAVTLGSRSGLETRLEVGYDPETKDKIDKLMTQAEQMNAEKNNINISLNGLKRQLQNRGNSLTKEKKQLVKEYYNKYNALEKEIKDVNEKIIKHQEYLESLVSQGKISASSKVLVGVTLRIRDVEYQVKESHKNAVTFVLEDDYIKTAEYQNIEEDLKRGVLNEHKTH